jgi:hypothetical protein
VNMEHVADVRDTHTGDVLVIYRCDECWALVQSWDTADHVKWHRRNEAAK